MDHAELIRALITSWTDARCSLVGAHSGDMNADWAAVVAEAHWWAFVLDVPWEDDMIPVYVREALADWP